MPTTTPTTVMLVDDDPDTRQIFGRVLTHMGYRVIEAALGAEAIATARAARPDVVLLDLGLPDMDGLTVAAALRADAATAAARILVLTAYVSPVDRARAAAAGCDVFLVKPILPRDLLAVVQQACCTSCTARAVTASISWRTSGGN